MAPKARSAVYVLAIVTMVTLLAFVLAAISPSSSSSVARGSSSSVDWSQAEAGADEVLTISVMMLGPGEEGGWVERFLEAQFQLEIKPVFIEQAAFSYRKPLMLAGGEIPDLFLEAGPVDVQRDARHGFLLELPRDLILEHAPNYVAALNAIEPEAWLYAAMDGVNYGVPTTYVTMRYAVPGIWRADWLRKVGLVDASGKAMAPGTLDEVHEALRRFTYDDPDRNGKQDTYGMSGDITGAWWSTFGDVFGAFGVAPFYWMERDSGVVWGGVLPETREALALLRAWYAEGLISPDFVTDRQGTSLNQKLLNGRTGYLYYEGKYHRLDPGEPGSLQSRLKQLDPEGELVCGWLPTGPAGLRGTPSRAGGHVLVFGSHLASEPEKVLRVLRMLDTLTADEALHLSSKMGKRGEHWEYNDPGIGPASGVRFLPPFTDRYRARREMLCPLMGSAILQPCSSIALAEKYTARAELAFLNTYRKPEWVIRDALGKPDVVPSASRHMGDLRLLQQTVFSEIIRGDRELEDFDRFVTRWMEQGGAEMTEEANQAFRLKQRIFREVGAGS